MLLIGGRRGLRIWGEEITRIGEQIESILRESEEVDDQEDEQMGEDEGFCEVPVELKDKRRLREKLREAKEKLLKRGSKEINLTDEESTTMLHIGYRADPSYNGQVAVEGNNGVIVAASLSNNPADYEALIELIEQTEENTGEKPLEVLADSGFSSYENLQYLEEKDIEDYIPDQRMESLRKGTCQRPGFQRNRFRHEEAGDRYICPVGKLLPYKGLLRRKGNPDIGIYRGMDCPQCERGLECTKATYRTISLDPREFLMERIRLRLETEEGKAIYARRKYIVEPVFGDMKFNRKLGGLLLRRKLKAGGEFLIMCIAHNLRKIARYLRAIFPNPELRPFMV